MNTETLRQITALASTGSFSEAAAMSGVTQPAISLSVKKLERDLGVKLFIREGNRYVATAIGRILLEHAEAMLDAEERMLMAMEKAEEAARGQLRLATSNIPGEHVLPLILRGFKETHPHIEPILEVMDSSKVVEAVRYGGFEMGFMGGSDDPEDLQFSPFCPDTLKVICPPGHPLAEKRYIQPRRLAGEKFLVRERGSGTRDLMIKALREAGLEIGNLRIEMELGSTSAVISAVMSGAGISLVSVWAAADFLNEGRIESINVPALKVGRQFKMLWHKERILSGSARSFADYVQFNKAFLEKHFKKKLAP